MEEPEETKETETTELPQEEEEPATDWAAIQAKMYQSYVLDQMGLSSLKMQAESELNGTTDELEDIPTEEEAEIEYTRTMEDWEKYLRSAHITGTQRELKKLYEGPYKLIAYHQNTRRPHWHVIYYSFNKQWGFNSRLGRTIRRGNYKNKSVDCQITCLREYLYSGNGRQIVQDILRPEHIRTCECAEHNCGMDGPSKWKVTGYEADCTEGGNSVYGSEGEPFEKGFARVADATLQADVGEEGESGHSIPIKTRKVLGEQQDSPGSVYRTDSENGNRDANIIILLCEGGAFTEAQAMGMFAKSTEGIKFVCSKQYAEKIRTYLHLARVLVLSESIKQRFERAKAKFEKENLELMDETRQEETTSFKEILVMNGIALKHFFINTFHHFTKQSNKRNNLFFLGPPSTGKTMIMNSLVECHFNFCRLTGLISNSSFNFSGLLHTNACLMDECKLTDNQFEQWKLLASGLPMSTDVKYKDRCDVHDVVLYTCSNYPIEMYCNVPMAQEAVKTRTITYELRTRCPWYLKISPHIWEKCWYEHGLTI